MRTYRGINYSIFNLLPNENYMYHFRIELIGLELTKVYSVLKMGWRLKLKITSTEY